ncbi:MAG: hypothetical protein K2F71_01990 [Paramuribaculum sp.]|nr:hypothetical protein [Paramuribaculum sp.]
MERTLDTRSAFQISASVITKIKALPAAEGRAITSALANEYILGEDPRNSLTPTLMILYTFIKHSIEHDRKHS